MIRFLLFRLLPRRILPFLVLYEAFKLVTRIRRRDRADHDDRIIEGRAIVVPGSEDVIG